MVGLGTPGQTMQRQDLGHSPCCGEDAAGALYAPVPGARLDRSVVRGCAMGGRQAPRLDAQPGRLSAARRSRAGVRHRALGDPLHPRRRRGLLRPQRRRRRGARRRAARARDGRPAGQAAVDARRRVHVGALRLGDGDEARRRRSTRRATSRAGRTSSGAIRTAGARASRRARTRSPRGYPREAGWLRAGERRAAARRRRRIATRFRCTTFPTSRW